MGGQKRTYPTATEIWTQFNRKDKRTCAENGYDCLRYGGYSITLDGDKKSYQCGCLHFRVIE